MGMFANRLLLVLAVLAFIAGIPLALACDPAWKIDPCRGVIGVQV
jgi:hypothetical protein